MTHYAFKGPFLSTLEGPVDMLLYPKVVLMNGYRFQNSMFPPVAINQEIDFQEPRVGAFTEQAIIESYDNASSGAITQMATHGDQDRYLYGDKGQAIEDHECPFCTHVSYARPQFKQNPFFSQGDMIQRYKNEHSMSHN
jgi:hypothetical protein